MRKKVKLITIAIVAVSAFVSLIIVNFILYEKPETLEGVEDISLFVDYNNGTIKTRTNFTLDNGKTTALDALEKWCIIRYDDFGWGILVIEIDGVSGNWIYTINNFFAEAGASVYPLESGDLVTWIHI
ncbi:MAG: hypothetical protein KAW66_06465 [Candidatus Lokiarchaeota archaeon]|nr:hypothetical protein [Candidatus Lokiarchaeota archaeon]